MYDVGKNGSHSDHVDDIMIYGLTSLRETTMEV
jgi:hypothetical protein